MSALDPSGAPVRVGDAVIRSPGLEGRVKKVVRTKDKPQRSPARTALETALARQGLKPRPPIVLTARALPAEKGTRRQPPKIELEVPDPGPRFGQVLLHTDQHGIVTWIPSLWDRPLRHPRGDRKPARKGAVRDKGRPAQSGGMQTFVIDDAYPEIKPKGPGGAIVSKLLEVFVFPRVAAGAGKVAEHFAARWEEANRPYQLRRLSPDNYTQPAPSALGPDEAAKLSSGRALLFLHGTFARAHTVFNSVPVDVMKELDRRYGGRVIAFNHFTITDDPLRNAQAFIDALPPAAKLDVDLICHSRGGLVGRALAEGQALLQLDGRQIKIGRVVFAGSPNAGCVLADAKAMSHWMDRYTNWAAWLPTPGVVDIFEGLLSVVKQLAVGVLEGMPGLQSMVPEGEFLKKFAGASAKPTQYYALGSDYEPPDLNLNSFAHNTLMDNIFREANDLVVPMRSVWDKNGSTSFPVESNHLFKANDHVDHGGYFRHPVGKEKILSWLTGA